MIQDLSHSNLRKRSFAGQNLTNANFSGADIRGTDFSGACLVNTDFSYTKAGLPPQFVILLQVFCIFLAMLSGLISAFAGAVFGNLFSTNDPASLFLSFIIGIALLIFGITTLRNGLGFAIGVSSLIVATAIIFTVATTDSSILAGNASSSSLVFGGSISGLVGLSGAISLSRSSKVSISVAFIGIVLGAYLGISEDTLLPDFVGVTLLSVSVLCLSAYTAYKSLRGDSRYRLIHNLTISLSTIGGTRFCNANLTDAKFIGAVLNGTDFRGACLIRVRWLQACLERANLEDTSIENPRIRQILINPAQNGIGQNLDRLDLQGANLQDANLSDASLVGTDLSNATLQNADLSRAKLVQAQMYGTNLSGACLTGAYIQNWGIAPDTNLNGVKCDYIYLHLPTPEDQDPYRKPDNRQEIFREGEFVDFIAPIIRTLDSFKQQNFDLRTSILPKTLDLFHHEGIDPRAATVSLRQLIEQNPDANIEVLSIEGRGQNNIRIQAKISDAADRSQLNSNYFENYNKIKALAYQDFQQILASFEEKDSRFRSLENMVMTAIRSDKFYIETKSSNSLTPKNILILSANPRGTNALRLDEEVREIQRDIERGKLRDQFVLQQRWAVQVHDIRRALLDYEPQILHFSGHGIGSESLDVSQIQNRDISISPESIHEPEGLVFENETGQSKLVSIEALSNLFQLFAERIECVILNACYSEDQATAISEHIPYVIGMKRAIGDRAAIEFAIGFYDGLLAGKSIEFSYKLGCSAIQTAGIPEHLTPVLKRKES
jgi:uncharacterized protein YjbI with pentapeptide repeats